MRCAPALLLLHAFFPLMQSILFGAFLLFMLLGTSGGTRAAAQQACGVAASARATLPQAAAAPAACPPAHPPSLPCRAGRWRRRGAPLTRASGPACRASSAARWGERVWLQGEMSGRAQCMGWRAGRLLTAARQPPTQLMPLILVWAAPQLTRFILFSLLEVAAAHTRSSPAIPPCACRCCTSWLS